MSASTAGTRVEKAPKSEAGSKKAKVDDEEIKTLRAAVVDGESMLAAAHEKTAGMRVAADQVDREARTKFLAAVAPYKAACRRAGVPCEYRVKAEAVSPRVHFLVTRVAQGVEVEVVGRSDSRQVIPASELDRSIMKAASTYCEKYIGPASEIGAKHAGLYNRIRRVMARKGE